MEHASKQEAYAADITYGTNNEFGFDYLRDNMVYQTQERVQRKLVYAIVDEVDSILIDEARTPLIISGQAEDTTELYYKINELVPKLTRQKEENGPGDFSVDEKAHQVLLTEAGHEHAEEMLTRAGLLPEGSSLYDAANITLMHHLYAALRAHTLYHRDQHYVAQNDEIIIVDEFTGRLMPGRRWSDGLHQAVEAKEGVKIQRENQTLASITFQNYFRMYKKLAGMTGTADTEAYEFQQIYNLETVVIPTHMPMIREDRMDQVFQTAKERYQAVINDIKDCYQRGQPVLVGTTSIENSELLSGLLNKEKLPHQVLNAKQHAREAEIIVQAGRPKMITIATNMAGRGTDIVLGGNPEPEINQIKARRVAGRVDQGQPYARGAGSAGRNCTKRWWRRRPAHRRHRATRIAPRGQPAARPLRPSGRPGLQPVLSVARRSAAAHFCVRPCRSHHGSAQDARGRGDRAPLGYARDRECAAQGGSAQLRHPQAVARIRRRGQRPAPGHLSPAQRTAGEQRYLRHHPRDARGHGQRHREPVHAARQRRGAMGYPGPGEGAGGRADAAGADPAVAEGRRVAGRGGPAPQGHRGRARALRREARLTSSARRCTTSSAPSCCRRLDTHWREHLATSTICARASICAAMRRRIPSRSTSAKPSSCSP